MISYHFNYFQVFKSMNNRFLNILEENKNVCTNMLNIYFVK